MPHSLRRTTAIIIYRIFKEILPRPPSDVVMKRVYKLMGWSYPKLSNSGRRNFHMFNHYTHGAADWRLKLLPPVATGICKQIFNKTKKDEDMIVKAENHAQTDTTGDIESTDGELT